MPTTAKQILLAAYPKSMKNKPGAIAAESTELLGVVTRALQAVFTAAARVNPYFFASSREVDFAAPGWRRPTDAESIYRIELPNGTEVLPVDPEDRTMEAGMPCVYELGQVFRPAGNPLDPAAGKLVFSFSKAADVPANLDAALDPMWVERHNELLNLEVAIYLAMKDGRGEEIPALVQQRDARLRLFFAFLEHATANVRKRYNHFNRINTASMIPLHSLFAGGTSVELPAG